VSVVEWLLKYGQIFPEKSSFSNCVLIHNVDISLRSVQTNFIYCKNLQSSNCMFPTHI